jgi:hypothetical protein
MGRKKIRKGDGKKVIVRDLAADTGAKGGFGPQVRPFNYDPKDGEPGGELLTGPGPGAVFGPH